MIILRGTEKLFYLRSLLLSKLKNAYPEQNIILGYPLCNDIELILKELKRLDPPIEYEI